MNSVVIDASVAVKWVVPEIASEAALRLRGRSNFFAPELLTIECTNILWKKVRLGELAAEEALLSCGILAMSDIDFVPMARLMEESLRLATTYNHSAYGCVYLALAAERDVPFLTADEKLVRKFMGLGGTNGLPTVKPLLQTQE